MGITIKLLPAYAMAVMVTLMLAMAILVSVTPASAEDTVPTITVTIDAEDGYQSEDVSFTRTTVWMNGWVRVSNILGPETIKVTIEGTPWDGSVEEKTEQVTSANPNFKFSIPFAIQKGEVEGEYTGQVVAVWVSSTGDNTVKRSDDFTIRVRSIPFDIDADPVNMLADPGDTKRVSIEIHDQSPMGFTYLSQVGEIQASEPGDWYDRIVRWLDVDMIEIGAGGSESITLEVVIPVDATSATLSIPVHVQAQDHPEFARTITVAVHVQGVPIKPPVTPEDTWLDIDPMVLFTIAMVAAAIGFIGFFGFTEVGLLFIMWSLLMPLFTRLKKKEVLNQFTRGEIYGFIEANPGVHLTAIKENLGLANGVLAYHLKVLIREEFIVARREGGYKRFYPRDMRVPRKRVHFTRLQLDIVEKLSLHPGSTQASIARMLGESKQVINYNVGVLVAAGVLRVQREGSKTLLFVEDATALRPQVQVAELVEEGTEDEESVPQGTPMPVRWQ